MRLVTLAVVAALVLGVAEAQTSGCQTPAEQQAIATVRATLARAQSPQDFQQALMALTPAIQTAGPACQPEMIAVIQQNASRLGISMSVGGAPATRPTGPAPLAAAFTAFERGCNEWPFGRPWLIPTGDVRQPYGCTIQNLSPAPKETGDYFKPTYIWPTVTPGSFYAIQLVLGWVDREWPQRASFPLSEEVAVNGQFGIAAGTTEAHFTRVEVWWTRPGYAEDARYAPLFRPGLKLRIDVMVWCASPRECSPEERRAHWAISRAKALEVAERFDRAMTPPQ